MANLYCISDRVLWANFPDEVIENTVNIQKNSLMTESAMDTA